MRCLNATFYAIFSELRRGRKAGKKSSEMLQNFIFNALS